jgi:hypothetical protein
MMEKVRSIAMISSLKSADGSCGLISVLPVHGKRRNGLEWATPAWDRGAGLRRFHLNEPFLKRSSGFHSPARA